MLTRTVNQRNPPLPKRKRVDSQGNDHYRLYAKDSGTTMLIAKGATNNAFNAFINSVEDNANRLGFKLEVKFIIAH